MVQTPDPEKSQFGKFVATFSASENCSRVREDPDILPAAVVPLVPDCSAFQ
jgi:hypothetical protein